MARTRLLAAGVAVAGSLVLLPAPSASAHVHLVTPLSCGVPASPNAGAHRTDETPAAASAGGPISGVIPVVRSDGKTEGEGAVAPPMCP